MYKVSNAIVLLLWPVGNILHAEVSMNVWPIHVGNFHNKTH